MAVESNLNALIIRIAARTDALKEDSFAYKSAMIRIGTLIQGMTKINIRRLGIYDRGLLINSVSYKLVQSGIEVGVYGVKYAAINEFGGPFTDRQRRAMFWALGQRGGPKREGKGVINGAYWRPRPYFRPAVADSMPQVMQILREALK